MVKIRIVLLSILLSGCAPLIDFARLEEHLKENRDAVVLHIKGYGPPLTGGGEFLYMGVSKEFNGVIKIKEGATSIIQGTMPIVIIEPPAFQEPEGAEASSEVDYDASSISDQSKASSSATPPE